MTYMIEVYCRKDQPEPQHYLYSFREENEKNICYTYEFPTIELAERAKEELIKEGYYVEGPSEYSENITFVLYYLNNYYCGDAEFDVIAASPSKEKVERRRRDMIEQSYKDQQTINQYHAAKRLRYEGYKKTIRDFMDRNFNTLKIYLPVGYKDVCTPEELKEMERMDRQAAIDWVVDVHPHVFYKDHRSKIDQDFLNRVFDFEKLTEPIPQIEVDKIEANFVCPDINTEYTEETLIIKEVEEL